jgi:hypothetical protein
VIFADATVVGVDEAVGLTDLHPQTAIATVNTTTVKDLSIIFAEIFSSRIDFIVQETQPLLMP